jgi:hypothetical protein
MVVVKPPPLDFVISQDTVAFAPHEAKPKATLNILIKFFIGIDFYLG